MSAYVCVKCNFRVDRMTLHARGGELVGISDNDEPHAEACPNGCVIDGARVILVEYVEGARMGAVH